MGVWGVQNNQVHSPIYSVLLLYYSIICLENEQKYASI